MKLILYMATSINGHISRGLDDTEWVSEIDWKFFDKLRRKFGIMVMGARTYKQFEEDGDFPPDGALSIVMTHKKQLLSKQIKGAIFTNKTPAEVVQLAEEKGFSQVMLIGGMTLNTSFLKAGLIDEIWIDIHPLLIGQGKTLFAEHEAFQNLDLIEVKKLAGGQILAKYKINR